MASIRLMRREAVDGVLPRVCVVCGAKARGLKSKNMSWYSPWLNLVILAGLLPFIIVIAIVQKRMYVSLPFCDKHWHHWSGRTLTIMLSLVAVLVLGCGLVALGSQRQGQGPNDNVGLVCGGAAFLGLLWLVLVAILNQTAVRPREITERSITLTGVSEEFIEALEDQDQEDDRYESDRPRRGWRSSARYEDEPQDEPRPRRLPPDAYEARD